MSDEVFAFDEEELSSPCDIIEHELVEDISNVHIGQGDVVVPIESFTAQEHIPRKVDLEDFELISVIGKGAYGEVFLVRKKDNLKLFAMKVLQKASIVVHSIDTEHTKNERSILEAIQHPFIVKLHYAFQCPSRLFLILTYCSGGELFSYLSTERMFTESAARFYIAELLLGLEHLHSLGIIYRDLKPENVMLDQHGHLMLTDFGLSKVAIDAHTVCGTIEFMAPEIIEERGSYDKAVDFWSLGIMLYDMLVGSPPFTGINRKKIMDNVLKKKPFFPKYVTANSRDLITKLLKKDPAVRLGSKGTHEIKSHSFFRKTNWLDVFNRKEIPPHVPMIKESEDISNFDAEFTSIPIKETSIGRAPAFTDSHQFLGFSFVADTP